MPNKPLPLPGPLSDIPVVGPVYDLAGHLLGTFDAKGHFIKAVGNVEKGLVTDVAKTGFDAFQKWISQNFGHLLLQIGEVLLGIVLVGVSLAHMTGADNVITKAVKTGIKAAPAAAAL
jgi:hypothetical protein